MKAFQKALIVLLIVAIVASIVACGNTKTEEVRFVYWNDCTALRGLKAFVEAAVDQNSRNYIPVEDRIAVFDMDGTLCGELFPEYLEYLLLAYRCLDDPTYQASDEVKAVATQIREAGKQYKTPAVSGFDVIHGEAQAKAFAGLTPDEFIAYVKGFLELPAQGFEGMSYKDGYYKPMVEVVRYLQDNDFTVYVVSGSDRMICRAVACEPFGIPANQIIGMDVTLVATNEPAAQDNAQYHDTNLHYQYNDAYWANEARDESQKDTLVRGDSLWIKNLKMNKVFQIAQEIGKQPVLSFGNSSGDVSMHEYTVTDNKYNAMAFMLIADDDQRDHADLAETNKRLLQWQEKGYTVISMKNDFKTIYGYDVKMTD